MTLDTILVYFRRSYVVPHSRKSFIAKTLLIHDYDGVPFAPPPSPTTMPPHYPSKLFHVKEAQVA